MPVYDPALEGFGNLGAALLGVQEDRRRREAAAAEAAARRQERDATLAQALQFHNEEVAQRELDRQAKADALAYDRKQAESAQAEDLRRFNLGQERLGRLEKETERQKTFQQAKDMAEMGLEKLKYFQNERAAKAKLEGGGIKDDQAWKRALQIARAEAGYDEATGKPNPVDADRVQSLYDHIRGGGKSPVGAALSGVSKPPAALPAGQPNAKAVPLPKTWTNPKTGEVLTLQPEGKGYAPAGYREKTEADYKRLYPGNLAEARRVNDNYELNLAVDELQRQEAPMRAAELKKATTPEQAEMDYAVAQMTNLRMTNPAKAKGWALTLEAAKAGDKNAVAALRQMYENDPQVVEKRKRDEGLALGLQFGAGAY